MQQLYTVWDNLKDEEATLFGYNVMVRSYCHMDCNLIRNKLNSDHYLDVKIMMPVLCPARRFTIRKIDGPIFTD